MSQYRIIFFCLFFNCFSGLLYAQKDNVSHVGDSSNHEKTEKRLNGIKQLSVERAADTLKRAELMQQIALLSNVDNLQRVSLLKQLTELRTRDSLRLIKQKQQVDSLRRFVKGYPVTLAIDTLFYIYIKQGSFLAKDRAEAVSGRLKKLSEAYNFAPDSLKTVQAEQTTDVIYKDNLLISISEQDALWANMSKDELAMTIKKKIAFAVSSYQKETSWQTVLKQTLIALLVIIVVAALIYGINRLFRLLIVKTTTEAAWYIKGIKMRNWVLLDAGQQLKAVHWLLGLFKWMAVILTIYLALPVLFGIFPFTRHISNLLLGYILNPLKHMAMAIVAYIPNLITIIVVVVIFRYVLKFFRFLKNEVSEGRLSIPGFYADWANPTYQILRVLVLAFMLVVIFPYMPGSDSGIFKGVSVFIGVLFTFGSAGALGNVVAGLVLTYMRAFKIGDRVKIGEVTGDIIGRSLLVTRVRTIQNEVISIPNSTVMNNHTTNYSSEAQNLGLIIHTTVTIGYDAPWRQVHELLIAAALDTALIEKEPVPYVYQTSLDDYYVSYRLNAFTKEPNKQADIYSSLHANIQDHFNKAGVEIMSPHYKALRDGNMTTIPQDYLPNDYAAPTFKTQNK